MSHEALTIAFQAIWEILEPHIYDDQVKIVNAVVSHMATHFTKGWVPIIGTLLEKDGKHNWQNVKKLLQAIGRAGVPISVIMEIPESGIYAFSTDASNQFFTSPSDDGKTTHVHSTFFGNGHVQFVGGLDSAEYLGGCPGDPWAAFDRHQRKEAASIPRPVGQKRKAPSMHAKTPTTQAATAASTVFDSRYNHVANTPAFRQHVCETPAQFGTSACGLPAFRADDLFLGDFSLELSPLKHLADWSPSLCSSPTQQFLSAPGSSPGQPTRRYLQMPDGPAGAPSSALPPMDFGEINRPPTYLPSFVLQESVAPPPPAPSAPPPPAPSAPPPPAPSATPPPAPSAPPPPAPSAPPPPAPSATPPPSAPPPPASRAPTPPASSAPPPRAPTPPPTPPRSAPPPPTPRKAAPPAAPKMSWMELHTAKRLRGEY